jgi:uncharacterized OsmC-like protein
MVNRLASASVTAQLSGIHGRAIVSAKRHHVVVDSPIALGGPNEELNPVDMLLGALAAHSAFICERAARETGITLTRLVVRVTGEFDPRGASDPDITPYLHSLTMQLYITGPDQAAARRLGEAVQTRCLLYTTLARAVPIALETIIERSLPAQPE